MLRDGDPELRCRAAFALRHGSGLRDPRLRHAIPALLEAIRDPDFRVRREAGLALGEFQDLTPEMARALVALLRDKHPNVRQIISLVVVGSGPKGRAALAALREMQKEDGTLPREAADALKMLAAENGAERGVR
jgi:HEAT repeat protein